MTTFPNEATTEATAEMTTEVTADPTAAARPRAGVIGLGLMGGSVALALRRQGFEVVGTDVSRARLDEAISRCVLDSAWAGADDSIEFVVVATPVDVVADSVFVALRDAPRAIVTDVGSVKASIAAAVVDARFVPGHPMAGSELSGLDGAREDLFDDALWVLTPTDHTAASAIAAAHAVVSSLGAEAVVVAPERHDELVALVSHVPHLVAASLMNMAAASAEDHGLLLRLAAGGFRDMTRVAAGDPQIWPSICLSNDDAITRGLDRLVEMLATVRTAIDTGDRASLHESLAAASSARRALPARRASTAVELAEVVVPIPDRPGALADITTTASAIGVNIDNIELTHTMEGEGGVAVLLVPAADAARLQEELAGRGFRSVVRRGG